MTGSEIVKILVANTYLSSLVVNTSSSSTEFLQKNSQERPGPLRILQNQSEQHAILKLENQHQNGRGNGTGETTAKNTLILAIWKGRGFGGALVLSRQRTVSN